MKIFLIGLPGSGKSTIGRRLAELLQYSFYDIDDEIIREEKRTIEQIFEREGEAYFRQLECSMLNHLIRSDNVVISTGGGTPCFFDNMALIRQNGISIFLNVPLGILASRLQNGKNKNRPMVSGKSNEMLLDFLKLKSEERFPFYHQAHLELTSPDLSAEQLLEVMRERQLLK